MTEQPLPNSPEARTPDWTLTTPTTPTANPNGQQQPTDATATSGQSATDGGGSQQPTGAPETYADFSVPEGHTIEASLITDATPIFKELGLSQDQAQKLVDFYTKNQVNQADAAVKFVEAQRQQWRDQVNQASDLGPKISEISTNIGRMKDALLSPAERQAFDTAITLTGAGDHPDIVRAFAKFAQRFVEGSHVSGGGPVDVSRPNATPPSAAQAMYPNLPSAGPR